MDIINHILATEKSNRIELKEKQFQTDFCTQKEKLPIKNLPIIELEQHGFVFHDRNNLYTLSTFVYCEFPNDWKLIPTSSSFQSELCDENNICRVKIFHKVNEYTNQIHCYGNYRCDELIERENRELLEIQQINELRLKNEKLKQSIPIL